MINQTDLKMQLICSLRGKDVELSEDLHRRMGPCDSVAQLNSFFHSTLAAYTGNTIDLRSSLLVTEDYPSWYSQFLSKIFPFISKKRLPPCTDTLAGEIYSGQSKSL